MNELTAKINEEQLQEAIDKAALKGAIEVINDYYSGYNSPYKKALREELENKKINTIGIKLPDIIGLINEKLSKEIEIIANNSVAQTFLPMLQDSIFRHEKEVNFSDILMKLIKEHDIERDGDDWEIELEEHKVHQWITVKISGEEDYNFTMYEFKNKDSEESMYKILSLPRKDAKFIKYTDHENKTSVDIPMLPAFLDDKFNTFIASLIISGSFIELDCEGFEDWMFGDSCSC
jgi:hypothetical protein